MFDPRYLLVLGLVVASADLRVGVCGATSPVQNPCSPCTPMATVGGNCGADFVLVPLAGGTSAVCLPDYANANCIPVTNPPCYGAFGIRVRLPAGGSVQVPGLPDGPCEDAPAGGGWVNLPAIVTHPNGPPTLSSGCGAQGDIGAISIFPNKCGAPNGPPICTATFAVSCTDCAGIVGPS
jgi:hypothetical protein